MTQMPPPPGAGQFGTPVPRGDAQKPMSGASIASLVCSLVICIPVIPQLAGLITGAIGLSATLRGRARGTGFAIAGLVFSVLGSIVWGFGGMFMYVYFSRVTEVYSATQATLALVDQGSGVAFDSLKSTAGDEFFRTYQQPQIEAWLDYVADEYGPVQSIARNYEGKKDSNEPDVLVFRAPAAFQKQDGEIVIKLRINGKFDLSMIDIAVDGKSPGDF